VVFNFYKQLIQWRKQGVFKAFRDNAINSHEQGKLLMLWAGDDADRLLAVLNFNHSEQKVEAPGSGGWKKVLASSDENWGGFSNTVESIQGGEELVVPAASLLLYQSA